MIKNKNFNQVPPSLTMNNMHSCTDLSSLATERLSHRNMTHTCQTVGCSIIKCLLSFCSPVIKTRIETVIFKTYIRLKGYLDVNMKVRLKDLFYTRYITKCISMILVFSQNDILLHKVLLYLDSFSCWHH